ncbi:MAG: 4Fe-4S binding protein, partial [Bacteroidales bacterium]|nr:4Fe-4S binding protein [Bacteroidales bacterium]
MKSLTPVIYIDEEKCVNCHACITACPVKFCNDGSSSVMKINHNLCIGCGSCITACTHEARLPIDDFEAFVNSLNR